MKYIPLTLLFSLLFYGCGGGGSSTQPTQFSPKSPQERPMLLIRLSYDNSTFHNDAATWHRKIFGFEQQQLNHYFQEVSYGKFSFRPALEDNETPNDGIISITLNRNHPDSGIGNAINADLAQAISLAGTHIDFAQYDTDRNGALTSEELQITFIVAGNEDSYSGDNSNVGIWGHEGCTERTQTPSVDGVRLMGCYHGGNYAIFGERHGSHDATIGIIAHELGHAAFDLPDLYDTTSQSAGVGYFALMGGGMWGRNGLGDLPGATPTHLCAWSKTALNWVTPTTVTRATDLHVNLHASASEDFNIIKLPISNSEYFLLENRHNSGYDRGLEVLSYYFEGGLAIWHIDDTVIRHTLAENTVNDDVTHKGIDLEEASHPVLDTIVDSYGNKENLFYQGNVDAFTPDTTPSTESYTHQQSGIRVEHISQPARVMDARISL